MTIQISMPLWKAWIESMIGVTESWKPISPGLGWPACRRGPRPGASASSGAERDPERAEKLTGHL